MFNVNMLEASLLDEIEFSMDRGTMLLVVIAIIIYIIYRAISILRELRYLRNENKRLKKKIDVLQANRSHERTVDNFYRNRIDEDVAEIIRGGK